MDKRQAVEFLEYLRQDRNLERTIYGDALNMAIDAIKAQLSKEDTTSDLISRQAALDCVTYDVEYTTERIKALPSLQQTCNQLVTDCISRQAAIDAIVQCTNCGDEDTLREYVLKHSLDNGWTGGILEALDAVKDLPTAQPETAKRIVGKSRDGMTLWYQCDMCNEPVDEQDNYCRGCGRRLIDG